jgi:hypothetical protein
MSDKFININEVVELYAQELDAIAAGASGKDVPVSPSSDATNDFKLVGQNPTDSVIESVNKITTAFHLIAWNI